MFFYLKSKRTLLKRRIGYFLKLFCTKYSNSFVSKTKACLPLNVVRPEEIQSFLIIQLSQELLLEHHLYTSFVYLKTLFYYLCRQWKVQQKGLNYLDISQIIFFQVFDTSSSLYVNIRSIHLSSFFWNWVTPTRGKRMTFT